MRATKLKYIMSLSVSCSLLASVAFAQPMDNFGQTIEITTDLKSFVGKPSWLLIIRDVDHGQNIPYLFDFEGTDNGWVAFTYGRNYEILTSEIQFSPYGRKTNNFCNLQTMGTIQHAVGIRVHISGKLTPHHYSYNCKVTKFAESDFTISTPD